MELKRILVPIDGSANSMRALDTAVGIAKRSDSKLWVISVIQSPTYFTAEPIQPMMDVSSSLKFASDAAGRLLESVKALGEMKGMDLTTEVIDDAFSTVDAITEFAEANDVDLIVIGTRGLTGFKKLVLGSVSSGVVHNAGCSVMVVR